MPSVKNPREGTQRIIKLLTRKGQKMNSVHLLQRGKNGQNAGGASSGWIFLIFSEREWLLSKILAHRTVGF